jgi:ribosomal protein S18 acetylase RimI-like enzyme
MIEFKLVQATERDMPLLYSITQQAMAEVNMQVHGERKFTNEEKIKHYNTYVQKFRAEVPNTKLIQVDNNFIGRVRVEYNLESIHVGGIQILPHYQNMGIGSKIFDILKSECQSNGKSITLFVHKVNLKAIKFYERRGFKIISETEKQYKMEHIFDQNSG